MSELSEDITLHVDGGPDADAEEVATLTQQLRQELLDLEVEDVVLVGEGQAPAGAKGDPIAWGTLLVTLASGGVLVNLIRMLQSWITRDERRSVAIEVGGEKIDVKGLSTEEQRRLIEAWLERHHRGPAGEA